MLSAPMNGHSETIYCGKPHRLIDGAPVGHACRLLHPAYLAAERAEDYGRAASILCQMPLVLHEGVDIGSDAGAALGSLEDLLDGDLGDPRGRWALRRWTAGGDRLPRRPRAG